MSRLTSVLAFVIPLPTEESDLVWLGGDILLSTVSDDPKGLGRIYSGLHHLASLGVEPSMRAILPRPYRHPFSLALLEVSQIRSTLD